MLSFIPAFASRKKDMFRKKTFTSHALANVATVILADSMNTVCLSFFQFYRQKKSPGTKDLKDCRMSKLFFFLNMACQTSYFLEQPFLNINAATKFSRFSMRLLNYKRHKCSTVQLALAQRRDQFSWLRTIFSFLFISWQLLSCFWPKIKADLVSFIVQI